MKALSLLVTAMALAGVSTVVACSSSSFTDAIGSGTSTDGGKKHDSGTGDDDAAGSTGGDDATSDDGGGSSAGDDDSGNGSSGSTDGGTPAAAGGATPSSNFLPTKSKQTCPTLKTGMVTFSGTQVQLWAGTPTSDQHGSLVLYWHGTGSMSSEATYGLGQAQISAITAAGGIVASFSTTTMAGTNTGNKVWYTGDFDMADDIVACAITQLHIDPRKIYTAGVSAGGLQATWMAYARSGYIAAAAPISGGLAGYNGFYTAPVNMPQDPSNVPAAMVIHGALGKDVVGIDFAVASAAYEADVAKKKGYSMDCNTGGAHAGGPPAVSPGIWQFFQDHPFKVKPEPYATKIPSVFPAYCKKGPLAADGGAP